MIRKSFIFTIFFIFFVVCNYEVYADNIDSLKYIIQTQKPPQIFNAYKRIIAYYTHYKPDSAIFYAQEALQIANNDIYILKRTDFYVLLGDVYYYKKDYYTALEYYYRALSNKNLISYERYADILLKISNIYIERHADFSHAYDFLQQAQKLFYVQNDTTDWIKAKLFYAKLLSYDKKNETATRILDTVRLYLDKLNNKDIIALFFEVNSLILYNQGSIEQAAIRLKRALLYSEPNSLFYYRIKCTLSDFYKKLNKYKAALNVIIELDSINIKEKRFVEHTVCLLKEAEIYFYLKQYKQAVKYAKQALNNSKLLNITFFSEKAYELLSEIYYAANRSDLALVNYHNYMKLRNLRYEQNSEKEFSQLHNQYNILLDLQQKELALKNQQLLELENQKQKLYLILMTVIALLSVVSVLALLAVNRTQKRNEKRLKQLAEASLEALLIHDGNKILDANDRFFQMTGFKKEQVIGQSIFNIIATTSHALVKEKLNLNETQYYQLYMRRADGSIFEAEVLSKPFVYKKQRVKVVSLRDIDSIKQAIREMEMIKIRLKTILDTFPDGIIMLDNNGFITYASKAFLDIFEADTDAIFINKKFSDFLRDDYKNIAEFDISNIFSGEFNDISEYYARKLTGEEVILECKGSVFKDKNGQILGAVMIVRDVTIIRNTVNMLIETEARFKKLYDKAKDAIIIYDAENDRIIDANPAATEMFGLEYFSLLDKSIYSFLNVEKKIDLVKLVYSQKPQQFPLKSATKKLLIVQISASTLKFENQDYFLLIIRDMTEFYMQQQELKQIAAKLAESNRLKDKMFSIVAHDLRGGIGNIKQMLEFIVRNPDAFSFEEIFTTIKDMNFAASHLYDLLENLLNWAKSEQNLIDVSPQEINIYPLVKEIIDLFDIHLKNKNISIELIASNKNLKILADENMLKTVVRNLISNAIKFTPSGGKILLKLNEASNYVILSVQDTGVGIKKDLLDKLFNKDFFFTTRGTNNEKGTGLGLKLIADFVYRMNGEIWVESEVGKGTTFFVKLRK